MYGNEHFYIKKAVILTLNESSFPSNNIIGVKKGKQKWKKCEMWGLKCGFKTHSLLLVTYKKMSIKNMKF